MKLNKKIISGIIAIVLFFTGSYVIDQEEEKSTTITNDQVAVELERVIDGDTIVFTENNEEKNYGYF